VRVSPRHLWEPFIVGRIFLNGCRSHPPTNGRAKLAEPLWLAPAGWNREDEGDDRSRLTAVAINAPPKRSRLITVLHRLCAAFLLLGILTTGIQQAGAEENAPLSLSADAQEAAAKGVYFFRQDQFQEAREQFLKVTELAPTHPFGWVNLGSTDFRLGEADRAEDELKKAVRLDPTAEQAWLTLGIISYQKNALDAGLAALSQAVYLDPKDAKAHLYLGVLIRKKGWLTGAEDEMRKALELDEANAEAHFNLAVLCLEERPPATELARRHYYRALDLGAKPDPDLELKFKKKSPPSPTP
jgi:Flp pilus assembly protein TadD